MKLFKKLIKANVILWIFLLSPVYLHGYFHNIQEWSNGRQNLFLFSDKHGASSAVPQRIDLINAAKRMKAFVIAEDKLSPQVAALLGMGVADSSVFDPFYKAIENDFFEQTPRGWKSSLSYNPNKDYSSLLPKDSQLIANQSISPLIGLTQFCKQQGIPNKNIEFRFYWVLEDILEKNYVATNELKTYTDGSVLSAFYEKIFNSPFNLEFTKELNAFALKHPYMLCDKFLRNGSLYIEGFDKLFEDDNDSYLGFYKHLDLTKKMLVVDPIRVKKQILINICNASQIDAKILHEIYCNPQHESIFICAGNMHIYQISRILPDLGFNFIRNIGTSWDKEAGEPKAFEVNVGQYFEDFHFSIELPTKIVTTDGVAELEVESSGRCDSIEALPVKRSKKELVLK
ncbi:MAG: hypothetical protein V1646_02305 [bacterium]